MAGTLQAQHILSRVRNTLQDNAGVRWPDGELFDYLSDAQRETFWETKDRLLGMVAEVRADAVTQNQDGTYSLRFPRFKTFRGFEVGEKI